MPPAERIARLAVAAPDAITAGFFLLLWVVPQWLGPTALRTGLLMMRMQDSFATEMNLGEILVTEARVRFRESEGYAMVTGEEPRRALARALADAALRCPDDSDTRQRVSALLELETARQDAETTRETAMIAATRVNFDLMPGA